MACTDGLPLTRGMLWRLQELDVDTWRAMVAQFGGLELAAAELAPEALMQVRSRGTPGVGPGLESSQSRVHPV